MDTNVIRELLKHFGHMYEISEVKMFDAFREDKAGVDRNITVKILDMGPENPEVRYNCIAASENGKVATGNGAPTIQEALGIIHWKELD